MVSKTELSKWLVDNGYAEPKRGYGHVSGDDLADAFLARFSVSNKGNGIDEPTSEEVKQKASTESLEYVPYNVYDSEGNAIKAGDRIALAEYVYQVGDMGDTGTVTALDPVYEYMEVEVLLDDFSGEAHSNTSPSVWLSGKNVTIIKS